MGRDLLPERGGFFGEHSSGALDFGETGDAVGFGNFCEVVEIVEKDVFEIGDASFDVAR